MWNSRAEAGRLNKPNKLIDINDIKPFNDMTGGWIAAKDDKNPWLEVVFQETVNGKSTPFYAEVKGVLTQGLDGLKGHQETKKWTRTYQVN